MKLLFVIEGNTDIRFVDGLARRFDLTLLVPDSHFRNSGLAERLKELPVKPAVMAIRGGRLLFQWRSFVWLWKYAGNYSLILAQEILRGSLNANVAGRLKGVPVVNYVCLPHLEYFDKKHERGKIGPVAWRLGSGVITALSWINGRLAKKTLALGEHLQTYARRFSTRVGPATYYGVDVKKFTPASPEEKAKLRQKLGLPQGFLVLYSSRLSHEKDPETFLLGCEQARWSGIPLVALNLSGDYRQFLKLAETRLGRCDWIFARDAVHPMHELADYYRAADCLVQSSLAEGLGLSPMEALACEVPVIATNVGGMAKHLPPYAVMVEPRDVSQLGAALKALYRLPSAQNRKIGREYVLKTWESEKGFDDLARDLAAVARR